MNCNLAMGYTRFNDLSNLCLVDNLSKNSHDWDHLRKSTELTTKPLTGPDYSNFVYVKIY